MNYGYKKEINLSFEEGVQKVINELKKQGFGILTKIDVKATLKKKINVDVDNYIILGACNPPNAHRALQTEKEIGLMLPCNVIVYGQGGKTFTSAILPTIAMSMIENNLLKNIAGKIELKLKQAIDAV